MHSHHANYYHTNCIHSGGICCLSRHWAFHQLRMHRKCYVLGDPTFQTNILGGDLKRGGAWISGILSLGLIVGGLAAGSSEGRAGRKYIMLLGLCVTSLAGLACAVVPNLIWMIFFRFVAGLGIGPILAATSPLATELSPPQERGFIVSVANSFWTVGLIFNAIWAYIVFGYFESSWRIYMVISTLPSILGFVLILFLVPESPRFLALQGRYEHAAVSANQVASAFGYCGPMLQANEIEYHYADMNISNNNNNYGNNDLDHQYTLRDKIRHGIHQIRLVYKKDKWRSILIVQILWVAASVGGSIGQWINVIFHKIQLQNIYLCFIFLNCTCIPGNIASAMLTDRIGRTKFFSGSMFLAGTALLAVACIVGSSSSVGKVSGGSSASSTTTNDNAALGNRTRSILFCTSFFYASMTGLYTCLYVMAAELFPTHVRSTGVAICSTFGRIASVLAMFMNGALVETPAVLLFVGATVLLSGCFLSIVVPPNEMKLKPVADRGYDSDNDEEVEVDGEALPMASQVEYQRRTSELKYFAG